MREIFCKTCGTLVMILRDAAVKQGTVSYCKNCYKKKNDIPDFLKGMAKK